MLQYIQRHGFTRITLQFPDDLLPHAASVAQELQQLLLASGSGAKVGRGQAVCCERLPPVGQAPTDCLVLLAGLCAGRHLLQPPQHRRGGSSPRQSRLRGELLRLQDVSPVQPKKAVC